MNKFKNGGAKLGSIILAGTMVTTLTPALLQPLSVYASPQGFRDSVATRNVYTQYVGIEKVGEEGNKKDAIHFDSIVQFHVNPLDLWGENNIYTLTVPEALKPYIDHVESDMYGFGGTGRHWKYNEEKGYYYAPLMSVNKGLFSNTWIGSNPNYVPTRIVLKQPWETVKEELKRTEGTNAPFDFVGYFSNGEIITDITNVTQIPLDDEKLQKVTGPGGNQLGDNFISNSFTYVEPNKAYDENTKIFKFDHYFHISPFVTYTTAMGNKPYALHFQVRPALARYIESVTITGIGVAGKTETFNRDNIGFENFDKTGLAVINVFGEPELQQRNIAANKGALFSQVLTGAYPIAMNIRVKFKNDVDLLDLMQHASDNGIDSSSTDNRNLYFETYLNSYDSELSPNGKNGVVKNSYSGSYLSFKDTDKDGLIDRYELYRTFTDINNPDTDGDGKNDKQEIEKDNTDPNVKAPEVKDVSYDSTEYVVNTQPYRLVKLYDTNSKSYVAEARADAQGIANVNITGKLQSGHVMQVHVFTDNETKGKAEFTRVYTNPEISENFNVLTEQTSNNFNISLNPWGSSGSWRRTKWSLQIKTNDTKVKIGDTWTARIYNQKGELINTITKKPKNIISAKLNEELDFTEAWANRKIDPTDTLSVTLQKNQDVESEPQKITVTTRLDAPSSIKYTSDDYSGNMLKNAAVITNYSGENAKNKKVYMINSDMNDPKKPDLVVTEKDFHWDGATDNITIPNYFSNWDIVRHDWGIQENGSTGRQYFGTMDAAEYDALIAYVYDTNTGAASDPYVHQIRPKVDYKNIKKIEIIQEPNKIEYDPLNQPQNEKEKTFSPDGMIVKITDNTGASVNITPDLFGDYGIVYGTDLSDLPAGKQAVRLVAQSSPNHPSVDQPITILEKRFDPQHIYSMKLITPPNQLAYAVDERFNPEGMTVELTDESGVKKVVNGSELYGYGITATMDNTSITDEETSSYKLFTESQSGTNKTIVFTKTKNADGSAIQNGPNFTVTGVNIVEHSSVPQIEPVTQTSREITVKAPSGGKVVVRVYDDNGKPKEYLAVDNNDGSYKVQVVPEMNLHEGQPIDAILTEPDKAPTTSEKIYVGVEASKEAKNVKREDNKIKGETEAKDGSKITLITDAQGKPILKQDETPLTGIVNNGKFEISIPDGLVIPDSIYVKTEEEGKSPTITGPFNVKEVKKTATPSVTANTTVGKYNDKEPREFVNGTTTVTVTPATGSAIENGDIIKVVIPKPTEEDANATEERTFTVGENGVNVKEDGTVTVDLGDEIPNNTTIKVSLKETDKKASEEVEVQVTTDKTELEKTKNANSEKITNPNTEAERKYNEAIDEAEKVLKKENATQKEIDAANKNLQEAKENLEKEREEEAKKPVKDTPELSKDAEDNTKLVVSNIDEHADKIEMPVGEKTVVFTKGEEGNWSGKDSNYSIEKDGKNIKIVPNEAGQKELNGKDVTVTLKNSKTSPADEGKTSNSVHYEIVESEPSITPPTLMENVVAKNNNENTIVRGTTEANTNVKITDNTGQVIGEGVSNDEGIFEIEISPKVDDGSEITVTAVNEGGEGASVRVKVGIEWTEINVIAKPTLKDTNGLTVNVGDSISNDNITNEINLPEGSKIVEVRLPDTNSAGNKEAIVIVENSDGSKVIIKVPVHVIVDEYTKIFDKNNIAGIKIKSEPNKMSYIVGEEIDLIGMVIVLTDKNGNTVDVTPDKFSDYNITTLPNIESKLNIGNDNKPIYVHIGDKSTETTSKLVVEDVQENNVDKSRLEEAINKGREIKNSDKFIKGESKEKNELDNALTYAKKVNDDAEATQEDVDEATEKLNKAIEALLSKKDSENNKVVEEHSNIDKDKKLAKTGVEGNVGWLAGAFIALAGIFKGRKRKDD